MHILGGRGGLEMTDSLRTGCAGFLLTPKIASVTAHIFDLWQSGQTENADALYAQAIPAVSQVMQLLEHLITYGKCIFAAQSGMQVSDRAPCLAATDFGLKCAGG